MKFENRVAIVTGAARGIGRAIALAFVREGAKVSLVDMDTERLDILRNEIAKGRGVAIASSCDITKSADVAEMVRQTQKAFGRIDILVNNAGIIRRGTIETVTEEDWDRVIEVNLKGAFNCCKAVVETMKGQRDGRIVNVSSIAGKLGNITSAPGCGSSKAGMDALTKTLARQLAAYGIRVNGVAPHAIEAARTAEKMGLTVSLDLNYRAKLWKWGKPAREVMTDLVKSADIAIGNEEDAERVFGIQAPSVDVIAGKVDPQKYRTVAEKLNEQFPNLDKVAITVRGSISASHNT